MENVLIVSNTGATLQILSLLLKMQTFSRIVTTKDAAESRHSLICDRFDLIVIDTPMSDEFGLDFARYATEQSDAGIILITPAEVIHDVNEEVEKTGVFVLPKPIGPEYFYQAVKLLDTTRRAMRDLRQENRDLQNKLRELRVVDRAKCVLIQYLNMTEAQAHRHIEKQSMDLRQNRVVTAENILKTYEN
jgi:response regulator NasT